MAVLHKTKDEILGSFPHDKDIDPSTYAKDMGLDEITICEKISLFSQGYISRKELTKYAALYGIEETQDDNSLVDAYLTKIPCEWISNVLDWTDTSVQDSINLSFYAGDSMMTLLHKIRKEIKLSPQELLAIQNVNETLYRSPRPNQSFMVVRAVHTDPQYNVGDIINFTTPKSGSFNPDRAIFHAGSNGAVILMYVPANAVCSYHESEDQVIFPTGTEFRVETLNGYGWWNDIEIKTYTTRYILHRL